MDMAQLNYFITTVEARSTTRAAEQLHITQPALSKSIAKLERELGIKLFSRAGRSNVLTKEGQAFFRWAKKTQQSLACVMREITAENANSVNVAINSINATNALIHAFCVEYPAIRVNESTFSGRDFPAVIYRPDVDCVLATAAYEADGVNALLVRHSPLYLACAREHPLAARTGISIQEVSKERFVFPMRSSLFYHTMTAIFEKAGYVPNVVAEAEGTHTYELVKSGVGITICSGTSIYSQQSDCAIIRLTDDFCYRDTFLLWEERETMTSALSSFIDFAAEMAQHGEEPV